ncbi:MAG: V-type ATPase 116kDa subunit family protein, partial [Oscillospiraceae bacterium]
AKMRELSTISDIATMQDIENLQKMKIWAEYNSQIFEMQKYAVVLDDSFLISGYVPKKDFSKVKKALEVLSTVKVSEDDDNAPLLKTPVKLKNNWFSRPFEMFVNMYGLPSYGDIDPTTFVSITYAILFGIMFGDIGQGVLLGIIGFFIMYKKMHMDIGLILARCSVFSVFFGFMYGSVFGFENALDPLYKALGMNGKPIEVMSTEATNFILIASIVFGIVIIAIALLTGAFSKIRRGKIPEAIFNVNGFAGFVFYVAVVALAGNMLLGLNLPFVGSTAFIVVFLGLPFVMMFLAEPICNKINKVTHKEKLGEMLTNGFFEMFDAALSFASNTMSFLRVGGFVLAHAGMMSVVFTLANMSSGVAYVLILVVGNLFVMALEGLFVGIQVLRLEFYEIFSRFLDADGVAFKPLKVKNKV